MNQEQVDHFQKDILIVDDTPANLHFLSNLLIDKGYKVRKALSGRMALIACQTIIPDIILLDIMMPEMDGYEVCQRLKADEKTCQIPVIFLSALDSALDKVKAFTIGGVDYITKPFQIEEVLVRVQNQLTIQQLRGELTRQNESLRNLNQNLEKLVEQRTKQLIEQERTALIGRLTQGMVHNLRTPLQAIMICNDLIVLKASELKDQLLLDYTKTIESATLNIKQMMENLLIEGHKEKKLELKLFNLNEILRHEIQLLNANLYFKYNIKKTYLFDEHIPKIPLISTHISQVFHNLINNAIDATWNRETKEITIITRQDEGNIYLEIKDTGCGIPSDHLSKIFDLFYTSKPSQVDERKAGEPTGTGLGLYTCLELLKPFNGQILVSSEVGKGSVFTVVLPK